MKVTLLLLENIEQQIQKDIRNFFPKEDEEERKLRRLIGNDDDDIESEPIVVDITKYYKKRDFYFRKTDVTGLFMSSSITKDMEKIMVIVILGKEYDCVYDEEIFDKLKQELEKMKQFFIYKGSRTLNTQNGPVTLQTQEGFAIDEVLDFTLIEKTEGTPEQVIVRLKNIEDVDKWLAFPKGNNPAKGENRFVRRNENSVHGINDEQDIAKFKEIFLV